MSYDPEFITRMLVGNLGYVLLVVSMMMTSMLLLRIFAIASGIVGGAYMGLWLGDPVGTVWECTFALAAVLQIALGLYRNRPAALSTDEQALQAELMLDFEPRHVRAIRSVGLWQESRHGTELMRQGELVKSLIVLRSGSVHVLVNGHHVGTCGPGSLIGEIGFARATPATATVVANGPVRYLALECNALRRLMKSDSEISDGVNSICRSALEKRLMLMNEARLQTLQPTASLPGIEQAVRRLCRRKPAARAGVRLALSAAH
jgi:CRP-like cAMP-binding protein